MADPDMTDALAKGAGAGGGLVAVLAFVMSWVRGERASERNERIREDAEKARDKRHAEMVGAMHRHTELLVEAMREQSAAQLAGIERASVGQAQAFQTAGAQALSGLDATLRALSQVVGELKADVRELRARIDSHPATCPYRPREGGQ